MGGQYWNASERNMYQCEEYGLIWLKIGVIGEPLWIQHWTSGFHKPRQMSLLGIALPLCFWKISSPSGQDVVGSTPGWAVGLLATILCTGFGILLSSAVTGNAPASCRSRSRKCRLLYPYSYASSVRKVSDLFFFIKKHGRFQWNAIVLDDLKPPYASWIFSVCY